MATIIEIERMQSILAIVVAAIQRSLESVFHVILENSPKKIRVLIG